MLIVTARNPLERLYGSAGYLQIRSALGALAVASEGVAAAIDDEVEMQAYAMDAQPGTPSGVQAAIRGMARMAPVQSILLVGGDDVIPFWPLHNPVTNREVDPDVTVLSDNPYGALDGSSTELLAPSRTVARLPFAPSTTLAQVLELLNGLAGVTPVPAAGTTLFVNQDWLGYSKRAAQTMPSPQTWHIAPGFELDEDTRSDVTGSTLYFNLHGFDGDPDWKAYSTVQRAFLPAVTPAGLDRPYVAGTIGFAECCYGAQIAGRTSADSCALKLVQEGATFIGATGLAFGSYVESDLLLEDADFLARAFFAGLQGGLSVGAALQAARSMYLEDSSESATGIVWQCKQKTLLQFVLYGNPQTVH